MMNTTVILPAAGLGRRFAVADRAASSKIAFELLHKPVFLRAIELFRGRADVDQILLAVHPDRLDDFALRWSDKLSFLGVTLIAGSPTERWATVKRALEQVRADATHVAIHDAARPCASPELIERVFAAAQRLGAVVPGLPMADTVKRVKTSGPAQPHAPDPIDAILGGVASPGADATQILETVPRDGLYRVQTPQVFERGLLTDAYAGLNAENATGITDDASVLERVGKPVYVIEGDPLNLKLTHPADAELLEAVLNMREAKDAEAAAVKELFGDDEDA